MMGIPALLSEPDHLAHLSNKSRVLSAPILLFINVITKVRRFWIVFNKYIIESLFYLLYYFIIKKRKEKKNHLLNGSHPPSFTNSFPNNL